MPILYVNIMDGLPSDFARDAFLWAAEQQGNDPMCYRAERFANEADYVRQTWIALFAMRDRTILNVDGWLLTDDQRADLEHFILTRHANWRWGGNRRPAYLRDAIARRSNESTP